MSGAGPHEDEARRLAVLHAYAALDAPEDAALDELAALAAQICEAPVALVSLVDDRRQWFAARFGFEAHETPRDVSFCAHVLSRDDVLLVPDARQDERFAANPLVTGEQGIRFYAGAPLRSPEGLVLGALCVLDRRPRHLDDGQVRALRTLARQAMTHLELRRQAGTLADHERRLRAILETEPECLKLVAADGTLLEMNAAGLRMIEADSFARVQGRCITDLVVPEHRAAFRELIDSVFAGASGRLQFEFIGLAGGRRWAETHAAPLRDASGAITAALGITRDITDRHAVEERLRQSEERLRLALDAAHMGTFDWDVPANRLSWSSGHEEIWGFGPGEFAGTYEAFAERVHPDDLPGVNAEVASCIAERRPYEHEFRVVWPDGSVHWVVGRGDFSFDDTGRAVRMRGVVLETTSRKRAEARIVKLNRVHAMLSGINETIVRVQDAGRVLSEACRLAADAGGYQMAWIGLTTAAGHLEVRAHAEADRATLAVLQSLIAADPPGGCSFTAEVLREGHRAVCHDIALDPRAAAWRTAALERGYRSMAAFPLKAEERVVGTFNLYSAETGVFDEEELRLLDELATDISFALDVQRREQERRLLEEQLRQSQKMESVGRLAGGIAHDFNNVLTVINGMADLAMASVREQDPLHADLQQIRAAGERAAALTRQLLALSRRQILRPAVISLSAVIDAMRSMLRRLIGEDVEVVFALGDVGSVLADPGQVEQVILNLAVNARDAMPDGGTLTIETRNVDVGGPRVMVSVSDTGIGMDEATSQRIFEPFFTTKEMGRGTGLGLSIVEGIVSQSGGSIQVSSQPGRGATFQVLLPRVAEAPRPVAPLRPSAARGTETILLVEDEDGLRDLTKRILVSAGYTVLEASNGGTALLRLERHRGAVHLMLTDVVMPGMNGSELAARLTQLRPDMKVLYMSGYADESILRHGVLDDASRFIGKPFTAEDLRRKVRLLLDEG